MVHVIIILSYGACFKILPVRLESIRSIKAKRGTKFVHLCLSQTKLNMIFFWKLHSFAIFHMAKVDHQ